MKLIQPRRCIPIILLVLSLLLLTGCPKSLLRGTGPHPEAPAENDAGIRYYLPKHMIEVKGSVTKEHITFINENLIRTSNTGFVSSQSDIAFLVTPDRSHYYLLNLEPGSASADAVTIEVSPEATLTSINVDSTGKTGEVIKNIAKAAATVAPFIGGLADVDTATPIFKMTEEGKELSAQKALVPGEKLGAYDVALERFSGLPNVTLLFLKERVDARQFWEQIRQINAEIADREGDIRDTEAIIINQKKKAELDLVQERIAQLMAAVERLRKEKLILDTAFDAKLNLFKAAKKIARTTHVQPYDIKMQIGDLPPQADLKDLMVMQDNGKQLRTTDVRVKLSAGKHPKAVQLFDLSRIIYTQKKLSPYDCSDPIKAIKPGKPDTGKPGVNETSKIFTRQQVPYLISAYEFSEVAVEGQKKLLPRLVHKADKLVNLFTECAPVTVLEYETNAFAKRQLQVSFSPDGALIKVQHDTTSAAEAATGGISEGLTSAVEALDTSTTKLANIKKNEAAIKLSKIESQIAQLDKQKLLLDSQLALDGASANFDMVLERKQIDAQLLTLQSKASLSAHESAQELLALTEEVELLKQQTALTFAQGNQAQDLRALQLAADMTELIELLKFNKLQVTDSANLEINRLEAQIGLLTKQIAFGKLGPPTEIDLEIARLKAQIDLLTEQARLKALQDK